MCQDEKENKDESQSFGLLWNLGVTNEPMLQCILILILRAWFVSHRLFPEQTKTFAFVFVLVFVLAHDCGHWTPATWLMQDYHTNKNICVSLNLIRLHTFLLTRFTATKILSSAIEQIQKPQLRFVMVVKEVMCD